MATREKYAKDQPLAGARVAGCLHMSMSKSEVEGQKSDKGQPSRQPSLLRHSQHWGLRLHGRE